MMRGKSLTSVQIKYIKEYHKAKQLQRVLEREATFFVKNIFVENFHYYNDKTRNSHTVLQ